MNGEIKSWLLGISDHDAGVTHELHHLILILCDELQEKRRKMYTMENTTHTVSFHLRRDYEAPYLELHNEVLSHFFEQHGCWFVLTEQHQLQIQIPLQQQAFGHQAHPHHTTQGACGLLC